MKVHLKMFWMDEGENKYETKHGIKGVDQMPWD